MRNIRRLDLSPIIHPLLNIDPIMLECPALLMEAFVTPTFSHQSWNRFEITLNLFAEGEIERAEIRKAGDAEIEMQDVEAWVREHLTEDGRFAARGSAEEDSKGGDARQRALECESLQWSGMETRQRGERVRDGNCKIIQISNGSFGTMGARGDGDVLCDFSCASFISRLASSSKRLLSANDLSTSLGCARPCQSRGGTLRAPVRTLASTLMISPIPKNILDGGVRGVGAGWCSGGRRRRVLGRAGSGNGNRPTRPTRRMPTSASAPHHMTALANRLPAALKASRGDRMRREAARLGRGRQASSFVQHWISATASDLA